MATVADDTLASQGVNRLLGAGVDTAQAFSQQILRMNAGDQNLADQVRNNFSLMNQSANAVIIQALLGSDPTLAASILAQRSAGAQPQSGGGPGQPVSYPVQQALPAAPAVYSVNPTTGAITKA
jgi:hypothetical protein